jgi:hypothetical protein
MGRGFLCARVSRKANGLHKLQNSSKKKKEKEKKKRRIIVKKSGHRSLIQENEKWRPFQAARFTTEGSPSS